METSSSRARDHASRAGMKRLRRARPIFWLTAAAIAFAFFSDLAFRREPWPGAFGRTLSKTWWATLLPGSLPKLPAYNINFYRVTNPPGTNTFIAVGSGGSIVRSVDGGDTWELPVWTGRSDMLMDVSFINSNTGWAVGYNGSVFRTDNGGKKWNRQNSPNPSERLYAVHAITAARVIVGDWNGSIYLSTDGGTVWKTIPSPAQDALESIDFATPDEGLFVGFDGAILRTTDGGATWNNVNPGFKMRLNCVKFQDLKVAWATGENGTLLRSSDGGLTWSKLDVHTSQNLWSVAPIRRDEVLISGSGPILSTSDDGRHWTSTTSPADTLLSTASTHSGALVGVGDSGLILEMGKGGRWTPKTMGGTGALNDVIYTPIANLIAGQNGQILISDKSGKDFRPTVDRAGVRWGRISLSGNGQHGLVQGSNNELLVSHDGGRSWHDLPPLNHEGWDATIADDSSIWLSGQNQLWHSDDGKNWTDRAFDMNVDAIAFRNSLHGFRVGNNEVYLTEDGGKSWQNSSLSGAGLPTSFIGNRAIYVDANNAWIVGRDGFILHSEDGGRKWTVVDTGQVDLTDIKFLNDNVHGWIVGINGRLGVTSTGGKRASDWQFSRVQNHVLNAIDFQDANNGIAVGEGGTIIQSSDGGEHWKDYEPSWWPSSWYYASWIVVALIAAPAYRRPPPDRTLNPTIANKLVSDRPLEVGEPDALGLSKIAAGVSRFLRNENTVPPLTIAITGQWGTGKSSLMNLLASDLRANRFRPVFFNAWHSQQEQNVLASLLELIRKKGLPSTTTVEGVLFRTTLLLRRCRRHWLFICFLGLILAASAGLLEVRPNWLRNLWDSFIASAPTYIKVVASKPGKDSPAWLAFVVSAITAISFLGKSLQAFGVKPQEILNRAGREGETRKPYHLRFAEQFQDVAAALAPRRMVIFVDDLDRCRSQYVLDTLEAVNFLVSSGDCFVVMGLAPNQVKAAVGLAFKDIAEETVKLNAEPAGDNDEAKEEQSRQKREEYARQYLFKLVNMEIPVPEVDVTGAKNVLAGEGVEPRSEPTVWEAVRPYIAVASFLAALITVFFAAQWVAADIQSRIDARNVVTVPEADQTATAQPSQTVSHGTLQPPSVPRHTLQPPSVRRASPAGRDGIGEAPVVIPPQRLKPHPIRYFLAFPLTVLLIASLGWIIRFRINVVVRDSEQFTLALEHWQPILSQLFLTPRGLKRFLNKVRYLAMLRRIPSPERTLWATIARGARPARSEWKEHDDGLNETALVALAAMEEVRGNSNIQGVEYCKASHTTEFGDPLDENQRNRFLKLSQGLRVG
jgi:photosystem II stability/assembly factor-like uncharacterized protein